MTSKVVYNGNLRTSATHLGSGTTIITDAPIDNQGKGEAFSPTDLVATALASCALTIMGIAARNHQIDMEGATAEITKTMTSEPRRIEKVNIIIQMPGKNYSYKEIKVLEKAADCTPVGSSLSNDLVKNITLNWQ